LAPFILTIQIDIVEQVTMLTEAQIRKPKLNETIVGLGAMAIGVALVFGNLAVCGLYLDHIEEYLASYYGYDNAEWIRPAAVLVCFPMFLGSLAAAHLTLRRYPQHFEVHCPSCGASLTNAAQMLLFTRTCPTCNKHVIEDGQPRSKKLFKRYHQFKFHRTEPAMVQYCCLALLIVGYSAIPFGCEGVALVGGIKGGAFAAYGWATWRQYRFLTAILAGAALITRFAWLIWYYW
jgi:endogenous inhibitor of DNA gyrase (YacG/DUF329 family)